MPTDFCPKCGTPTKRVPSGISKRTGKPYQAFMACASRSCDWTGPIKVNTSSTPGGLGVVNNKTNEIEQPQDDKKEGMRLLRSIDERLERLENGFHGFVEQFSQLPPPKDEV